MNTDVLFEETQQFRAAPLWLGFGAIVVIVIASGVLISRSRGSTLRLAVLLPSLLAVLILLAVGGLLWTSRLDTRVRPTGIDVQFLPFQRTPRHIAWTEVRNVRSVTVRPIRDYGGWGIRKRGSSVAYLVTGDQCLEITRDDGSTVCIGTQEPGTLESAVVRARAQAGQ